jgi:transcriptional regulator with XRE-family HTH domain
MQKEIEGLKKLHQFYLYHDYKTVDIARDLNVSTRTVQRWLSGKTTPTEGKLNEIRKLLEEKRRT